jgi:hypothetical protein
MKKLRLDPEALRVESFAAEAVRTWDEGGTVHARQLRTPRFPCVTVNGGTTCDPAYTCPECAYTLDPCETTGPIA